MATLRNKSKLAAVSRDSRGQNTLDPELTQDYISQVSEEIEGRVTKKLSNEFSKTESRILGALSQLDEFLRNPQVRICSVAVPGTPRNNNSENRESTGDRSSGKPCPEASFFSPLWSNQQPRGRIWPSHGDRSSRRTSPVPTNNDRNSRRNSLLLPCTSSGKQKKARSTSQRQFRGENTPATIEADQILLALQQLATNSNSVNFNNNISRISKLPKSLTTTMFTFDEKIREIRTVWRSVPNKSEDPQSADGRRQSKLLPLSHAWRCSTNSQKHHQPNFQTSGEFLTTFRRKYVETQSMATAKH